MRPALAMLLFLAACGPRAVLGGVADTASVHPERGPKAEEPLARGNRGELARGERTGVVLSRLPAPHRFTRPVALTPATPDDARGLIGHRDPRTALAFALDTAAVFREVMRPTLDDRDALLAWAEQRGAFATIASGPLLPGDLLTFIDPTVIAVVLGTDARGVTDLCYLGGGVVRRGYLDPARPTVARDREGHVVNSYLRHGRDDPPPGTRYRAGELASGRIRL